MKDKVLLLAQEAQMHAVNAEVQGMIASNQERLSNDESIAYTDADFQEKANQLYVIYTNLMQNK